MNSQSKNKDKKQPNKKERSVLPNNSPLDVPGVDTDIKRDEIVDIIREIRER